MAITKSETISIAKWTNECEIFIIYLFLIETWEDRLRSSGSARLCLGPPTCAHKLFTFKSDYCCCCFYLLFSPSAGNTHISIDSHRIMQLDFNSSFSSGITQRCRSKWHVGVLGVSPVCTC